MAKRTKLTATQKLRKLVQQQVRRMERRGYRVDTSLKKKIKTGKYQTLKSIQKNKYKKLYESSSSEIEGNIVSGEQKRSYERSESAKRAAETRRSRRAQQDLDRRKYDTDRDTEHEDYSGYDETEWTEADERSYRDEEWERKRRERDRKERRLAELYDEGRIAYDNIYDLIGEYPTPGSKMLSNALRSEISKYGEEKVIQAMGTAPSSFIETAQMIIYYEEESSAIHSALVSFIEVITGVIVNGELAQDIGETMDEMTDMGSL